MDETLGALVSIQSMPVAVHIDDPVLHAVHAMNDSADGSVLVLNELDQLLGIFTRCDVRTRVLDGDCNAKMTPIGEVMTPTPVTADCETPLDEAHRLMRLHQIAHLPVVRDGEVIGIVELSELTDACTDLLVREDDALLSLQETNAAPESYF